MTRTRVTRAKNRQTFKVFGNCVWNHLMRRESRDAVFKVSLGSIMKNNYRNNTHHGAV